MSEDDAASGEHGEGAALPPPRAPDANEAGGVHPATDWFTASPGESGRVPGWYPEPGSLGRERFWDGADWTGRFRPAPGDEPIRDSPDSGSATFLGAMKVIGWVTVVVLLFVGCQQLSGRSPGSNPEVRSCFDSLFVVTENYRESLDYCERRYGRR